MKKRIFGIPLTVIMIVCLMFIMTVSVLSAEAEVTAPPVYVGGVEMNVGDYLAKGATAVSDTVPASGSYAHYEIVDGKATLTLSDYTYEGAGYEYDTNAYAAIYYDGAELSLVLTGSNMLITQVESADMITVAGIYVNGLEISGARDVFIVRTNGLDGEGASVYALHCSDLTVSGGEIHIESAYADTHYGVYCEGSVDISDGFLFVTGSHTNQGCGVRANAVNVAGGRLNVGWNSLTEAESCALAVYGENENAIVIGEELTVYTPVGGTVGYDESNLCYTFFDGDTVSASIDICLDPEKCTHKTVSYTSNSDGTHQTVCTALTCQAVVSENEVCAVDDARTVEDIGSLPDCCFEGTKYVYTYCACGYAFPIQEISIPATYDHESLVYVPGEIPDCQNSGSLQRWYCETKGFSYKDEKGTLRIDDLYAWLSEGGEGYLPVDPDNHALEDLSYDPVDESSHQVKHVCCNAVKIVSQPHTYTDGICVCGEPERFSVTVTEPENGLIEVALDRYAENESVLVTLMPNDGYELATLTVDGVDVTDQVVEQTYTFSMPAHDVAISATYTQLVGEDVTVTLPLTLKAVDSDGTPIDDFLSAKMDTTAVNNINVSWLTVLTGSYHVLFATENGSTPTGYVTPESFELTVTDEDHDENGEIFVDADHVSVSTEEIDGQTVYVITVTLVDCTSHVDDDADLYCDVCGAHVSALCADNDDNHCCDVCDRYMSELCADNDDNHSCDVCDTHLSELCADNDDDHHCDGCDRYMSELCADDDGDHYCDVCHTHMTVLCADNDDNHSCDVCDTYLSELCADDDGDHSCDVCDTYLSGLCADDDDDHRCDGCDRYMSKLCADENGDHFCDAQKCGERVSECSDADGDFRCDICEEEIRAVAWIDTDDDGVIDEEETKYLSLEDAFEDADLTVIKLNDDAVDFAFFISDKTVTLDLNGYTVTLDAWFDVADGASFTLKDSSQAMTGRIVCDYNNECYMDVYGTGIFVLESGTVDVLRLNGDNAAVMLNGGTVSTMIVSHGTVAVDDVDVTDWEISGGNFNVDPSTLNGFNSSSYKTVDNGDGTWTVEQEAAVNLVAALRGTSITLEGSIGMHVYFELDQSIVDSESAFVRFALSGGREIEIPVSEGVENTAAMPGQTLYIFTCELYATQMADEITIQVFMDDFSSNEYTHSVVAYANSILSNENGAYREETVALVKAMLNYGAYAQIYFDYNTENLANAELAEGDKDLSSVTVDSFAGYAASGMTMEGIGTFAGSSLVLDSETAMKLYFKPADGVDIDSLTFTLGTEILSPVQSGEYYVLSITNIASNDLDCKFEVNVNNGTKEGSFTCSVYSYCYNVLNSADHPEAHKNVVKALYLYNVAADNY